MAGGMLDQAQQAAGAAQAAPMPAPAAADLAQAAAAAGAPPPGAAAGTPPPAAAGPAAGAPPAGAAPAGPAQAPAVNSQSASGGRLPQGGKATGDGVNVPEEQATPEEQAEYERVMGALGKVLYSNEKLSNSIVDQVDPNDKVSSTSKVSMLLIQQLDQKVNMGEEVIAEVTQETVARIIELAEARHGIKYGDDEMQVILSATWEGIGELFGVGQDEQDVNEMIGTVGADNLDPLRQNHEAALRG